MKRIVLFCTFFVFAVFASAQSQTRLTHTNRSRATAAKLHQVETPMGHGNHAQGPNAGARWDPQSVGTTQYDLQSNGSTPRRLVHDPATNTTLATWMDGEVLGTMGEWPERGTGFNTFVNGAWTGEGRIGATGVRTGFPATGLLGDGTFISVAHQTTNAPPYTLELSKYNATTNVWTTTEIPNDVPTEGVVWPAMAVGGADGQTIHIITANWAPTTGRKLYYYRSTNGGSSWDIQDFVVPLYDGIYGSVISNSYVIDAAGEKVAIAVFDSFNDSYIFTSTDNGNNWTNKKIYDFPLDGYQPDQGYSYDDIPHNFGAGEIDSLAIFTTDGVGDVIIDANGKVHVTFGSSYVIDDVLTDTNTQYFPVTTGLNYWNEDLDTDAFILIADVFDLNGNDTFDLAGAPLEVPNYLGNGLTSFPSMALNEFGSLYVAYSGITERTDNNATKNYHHVYITKSDDGGTVWSVPYDVNNPLLSDPELYLFEEAVYPSLARNVVEDRVRLMYQMDLTPDMYLDQEGQSLLTENTIVYLELTEALEEVFVSVGSVTTQPISVLPNPSAGQFQAKNVQNIAENSHFKITNVSGQLVQSGAFGTGNFDLSAQPAGVYVLQIQGEKAIFQTKLVVVK